MNNPETVDGPGEVVNDESYCLLRALPKIDFAAVVTAILKVELNERLSAGSSVYFVFEREAIGSADI
jgi:hypothetical protein